MPDAAVFEEHRTYLTGLAYRMLGEVGEAEDAVQETYLRWQRSDALPDTPRAWLTTVCTRICLDRLRSAQRRRETYVGPWLPEPLLTDTESDAARRAERDDSLSMALLATIERLRPAERAAFLLHDVFGYTFPEVAAILELSAANCRQLASRARRHLDGTRRSAPPDDETVARLSSAFFEAVRTGELARLETVLTEDVVLTADGGGKAIAAGRPVEGRDTVGRFLANVFAAARDRGDVSMRPFRFNGALGMVAFEGATPVSAFHLHVVNGVIAAIYVVRNPDKLRAFA